MRRATSDGFGCIVEKAFTSPSAHDTYHPGDIIEIRLNYGTFSEMSPWNFELTLYKFHQNESETSHDVYRIIDAQPMGGPTDIPYDAFSPYPWYGSVGNTWKGCNYTELRYRWQVPTTFELAGADSSYWLVAKNLSAIFADGVNDTQNSLPFSIVSGNGNNMSTAIGTSVGVLIFLGLLVATFWSRLKRRFASTEDPQLSVEDGSFKSEIDGNEAGNVSIYPQELGGAQEFHELDGRSPVSELYGLPSETNRNESFENFNPEVLIPHEMEDTTTLARRTSLQEATKSGCGGPTPCAHAWEGNG